MPCHSLQYHLLCLLLYLWGCADFSVPSTHYARQTDSVNYQVT
jgi:hypothetical protein